MNGTDLLPVAIPFLLVLLVVGTLIAAAVLVVRMDLGNTRKRAEAFRSVAEGMGLGFHPQGINGYWGNVSQFDLFQHGRTRWFRHVVHGKARGVEVCVFDYQYVMGSDSHPQCWHQTAVGFRATGLTLPDLGLRARTWGNRFGQWMPELPPEVGTGYRDVVFPNHDEFSEHYQLYGSDEAAVRRLFTEGLLDYFTEHPGLNVEAHGDRLLVYGDAVRANPAAVRKLMEVGFDVLARFRPGQRRR
jgi:hypothetical protein